MSSEQDKLRIDAIFLAALEKESAAERSAYLDSACGPNHKLRLRVERLLTAQPKGSDFLESPAPGLAGTPTLGVSEAPGTVIGPYKLHEQIGEGGFGVVFMAEQHEPIRRKVAVKIVKPGMDSRQVIARFEAERQALALMDHPNIAKVLDAGQTPTGRPYFVMDLIKGLPITDFCDQSRLTPKERLKLFADVCRAVQHAHQKGIIHRDLKPSNVLVTLQDGTPLVKVIDFGIAKAMGQQLTNQTLLTGFAQTVGTPLYMAPEQTALSNADVDTRSDVYSLGVLLYELLTGTTPFEKERLHQASFEEMRRIISAEEPPRPSTRLTTLGAELSTVSERRGVDPRKLSQTLSGELDWIVMKALEKDRNRRYEAASALAADVERYLADEPVLAGPPTAAYRLRKFARRHRKALQLTVALLLLCAGLAGAVGWWVLNNEAREEATAQAVAKDLKEADIWQAQEHWAQAVKALERAIDRLEGSNLASLRARVEERRRDASMVARLEKVRLQRLLVLGKPDRNWAEVDRAFSSAFADYGLDLPALTKEEAAARIRDSRIDAHLVNALDSWAFYKDLLRASGGDPLRAVAQLADNHPWRNKLRDQLLIKDRAALEALAASDDVLAQAPETVMNLFHLLGKTRAPEAATRLLRSAQILHPTDFWINYYLGWSLHEKPETAGEAVGFFRAALVLQPKSAVVYAVLADALESQGNQHEAEEARQSVIRLQPDFAAAVYRIRGETLARQNKSLEAEEAFCKAISLNTDSTRARDLYLNLSYVLDDQRKYSKAEEAARQAIELEPDYAPAYCNLGNALRGQHNLREAVVAYRNAIELKSHERELNRPWNNVLSYAYVCLGRTLIDQHKLPEAVAALRKSIHERPKQDKPANIAGGWVSLGDALRYQHKPTEAEFAYRKAIEFKPNAATYKLLGIVLREQQKLTEAVAAEEKAVALKFDDVLSDLILARTLQQEGQFADALACLERAHAIGSKRPDWNYPTSEWIQRAEQLVRLDAKLSKILSGDIAPADAAERLALAELCQLPSRQHYAASAKFYSEAFAAQPELFIELRAGTRYDAACAAVRAGCGQGNDAGNLGLQEYVRLRGQALAWLRADLAGWGSEFNQGPKKARHGVQYEMQRWLQDTAFTEVRGTAALAKLTDVERRQWQELWEQVDELNRGADETK
jgi:serine/threonine protein kinase/cytochrome c-type biogenesis protein CcmH/NrfG